MSNPIRLRYAPSPTGHLHIGNARTAIFNFLFARHYGGKFIIRIEDTDRKRNITDGEQNQLQYLKWLGVDWDESVDRPGKHGPYRQTERLAIYQKIAAQLVTKGLAYPCYCSEEELTKEREAQRKQGLTPKYSRHCCNLNKEDKVLLEQEGRKASLRFKVASEQIFRFQDLIKGRITFRGEDFGDFVIVKQDGLPTYNFAVVVDDHLMEISHVLRGDDHLTNTPRQLMIYRALSWEPPKFGHMTLIVNEHHKKMSKRDESIIQFIQQYKQLGFVHEAILNYIALLGWSPEGKEEIFTREKLISIFDEKRLSRSPAVFDSIKLNWLNKQHLKRFSDEQRTALCLPHLQAAGLISSPLTNEEQNWVHALVQLYQDHLHYGAEIVDLAQLFFQNELVIDENAQKTLAQESASVVCTAFAEQIKAAPAAEFTPDNIKAWLKVVQKATGLKGKHLFMPIRIILTGQMHGPDLNCTTWLLGRDKVLQRLRVQN